MRKRKSAAKSCMCLLVFLLFVVMLNPPLAEGAEIYVKADAAGANDGTSWINACTSLQSALAVAVNGDEIWVAAGSYRPHASDRNVPFVMKNGVALYGGFAGNETAREQRNAAVNVTVLTGDLEDDDTNKVQGVTTTYTDIVGNNSRRVVSAIGLNSTVVLDGFTLTAALGNEMSDMGGGIFINSSDFTITDCTFSGNFSGDGGAVFSHINNTLVFVGCTFSGNGAGREGGGMYNYHRDATLTDCIFLGNSALRGGGLFIQQGSPTLTNCTFSGNIAGEAGGGVYQGNDSPSLTNCLFSGNSATVDGGGLFNYFGNIQLNGCTFSDNHAEKGGGLYSLTGSATLTGCTLSGNSAASGGGIRFFEGSFALTNCTFSGNSSTETGGGLYNVKGSATLTNCTLSGNTASSGAVAEGWTGAVLAASNCIFWNEGALEIFGGDKPLIIYSIVQGSFPGTGNMADNPNLGSLADNGGPAKTHALPPGSSAVDAGTSAGAPATDQRGVTRPHGAGIDMGAYELDPSTVPPTPPTPELGLQPVRVEVPLGATIGQKRAAVKQALLELNVPSALAEEIAALVNVDMQGYVYLSPGSAGAAERLLRQFDIPENAARTLLPLFSAAVDGSGGLAPSVRNTAVAFFSIHEGFLGKRATKVRAVKVFSAENARPYVPAFALEDLTDGRSAVVDVEPVAGGVSIRRVLAANDIVADGHIVALAIEDGGPFDLDGAVNGRVVDPVFLVEASLSTPSPTPSPAPETAGGGCSAGGLLIPSATLLLAPLVLLAVCQKK